MYSGDGPRKRRLNPFKVLCLLIYGSYDFVKWQAVNRIELKLNSFARHMQVPTHRLKDYLFWLQDFGYLSDVKVTYDKAWFKIRIPDIWQKGLVKKKD